MPLVRQTPLHLGPKAIRLCQLLFQQATKDTPTCACENEISAPLYQSGINLTTDRTLPEPDRPRHDAAAQPGFSVPRPHPEPRENRDTPCARADTNTALLFKFPASRQERTAFSRRFLRAVRLCATFGALFSEKRRAGQPTREILRPSCRQTRGIRIPAKSSLICRKLLSPVTFLDHFRKSESTLPERTSLLLITCRSRQT